MEKLINLSRHPQVESYFFGKYSFHIYSVKGIIH